VTDGATHAPDEERQQRSGDDGQERQFPGQEERDAGIGEEGQGLEDERPGEGLQPLGHGIGVGGET
jgi:hypothetical protein